MMKKTYEKPELQIEIFDVEDVIAASDVQTVDSSMEVPLGDLEGLFI